MLIRLLTILSLSLCIFGCGESDEIQVVRVEGVDDVILVKIVRATEVKVGITAQELVFLIGEPITVLFFNELAGVFFVYKDESYQVVAGIVVDILDDAGLNDIRR